MRILVSVIKINRVIKIIRICCRCGKIVEVNPCFINNICFGSDCYDKYFFECRKIAFNNLSKFF